MNTIFFYNLIGRTMKFTVELGLFQKILQKVMPAIPRKSTIPVLEHLQMSLVDSKMKIIATDQDIIIMSTFDVEDAEDGAILIPARKLHEIIRNYKPEGKLFFVADMDNFEIELKVQQGRFKLKGMDADEYLSLPELFDSEKPELPSGEPQESDVSPKALFKPQVMNWLCNKTYFAVSSDEFRPAMNGVLFQFRESFVNAVATDSYKLVRATSRSDKPDYPKDLDLIIPSRSVDILRKSDEDVLMSALEKNGKITHLRFDIGDIVFITKIIDEKFPPYENVIPTNNDIFVKVDQSKLIEALKRVAIVTSIVSLQVKLFLTENLITISGENEEIGDQGNEKIECEFNGPDFSIGFNIKYFQEIIQNIYEDTEGKSIVISFSQPTRPALAKPDSDDDNLLMLIMPVRI